MGGIDFKAFQLLVEAYMRVCNENSPFFISEPFRLCLRQRHLPKFLGRREKATRNRPAVIDVIPIFFYETFWHCLKQKYLPKFLGRRVDKILYRTKTCCYTEESLSLSTKKKVNSPLMQSFSPTLPSALMT